MREIRRRPVPVSDELFFVLSKAQETSRISDGAFDVTVGPVVRLWRQARRTQRMPDPEKLAAAPALVGWKNVVLDEKAHTVQLLKAGMQLDLGGIAKGYAADEGIAVLKKQGVDARPGGGGRRHRGERRAAGRRRLEDRHRPVAGSCDDGRPVADPARRGRVHVRRCGAVRRDRRQALFAHRRSENRASVWWGG